MLTHERFQLTDDVRMVAQREIRVDPCLGAAKPELLETSNLRLGEPLEAHVGECRATPEPERRSESLGRARSISVPQLDSALRQELLEAVRIALARHESKPVAACA